MFELGDEGTGFPGAKNQVAEIMSTKMQKVTFMAKAKKHSNSRSNISATWCFAPGKPIPSSACSNIDMIWYKIHHVIRFRYFTMLCCRLWPSTSDVIEIKATKSSVTPTPILLEPLCKTVTKCWNLRTHINSVGMASISCDYCYNWLGTSSKCDLWDR